MNRIQNDQALETTVLRIEWFRRQVMHLRKTECNLANFHASAGGFLAEIDRMQRDVREYLSLHPSELNAV